MSINIFNPVQYNNFIEKINIAPNEDNFIYIPNKETNTKTNYITFNHKKKIIKFYVHLEDNPDQTMSNYISKNISYNRTKLLEINTADNDENPYRARPDLIPYYDKIEIDYTKIYYNILEISIINENNFTNIISLKEIFFNDVLGSTVFRTEFEKFTSIIQHPIAYGFTETLLCTFNPYFINVMYIERIKNENNIFEQKQLIREYFDFQQFDNIREVPAAAVLPGAAVQPPNSWTNPLYGTMPIYDSLTNTWQHGQQQQWTNPWQNQQLQHLHQHQLQWPY
jgi:hypothetical protein